MKSRNSHGSDLEKVSLSSRFLQRELKENKYRCYTVKEETVLNVTFENNTFPLLYHII